MTKGRLDDPAVTGRCSAFRESQNQNIHAPPLAKGGAITVTIYSQKTDARCVYCRTKQPARSVS
jgi:hypothetical protein